MYAFKIENLTKKYPSFTLDNVSFSLEPWYIMGFIGRNGAGKTTTLKSMLKFVHPESGKVEINGFQNLKKIKTVTEVTKLFLPNWNDNLYRELMQKFNLDENKLIKSLSAGEHSILFSTHVTSDLDKCADYVTYIKNGKILESSDIISFKENIF